MGFLGHNSATYDGWSDIRASKSASGKRLREMAVSEMKRQEKQMAAKMINLKGKMRFLYRICVAKVM